MCALRMRPILSLLALLSLPALAAELPSIDEPLRSGQKSPRDAVVVIAAEDYLSLPDVAFANRDAQAVYNLLLYTRGIPSDRIKLLKGQVDSGTIRREIAAKGKLVGRGGTVWIYFAGHGAVHPSTGERMILPIDTLQTVESFTERGISVSEIEKLAGESGGTPFVWTDACFTGKGRGGEYLLADKRTFVPERRVASADSVLWSATQADQVSGPLPGTGHGAFTYFSVGALRGWADGELDGRRDGAVTAEEARVFVSRALAAVGVSGQDPELLGKVDVLVKGGSEKAPALSVVEAVVEVRPPQQSAALGTSFGAVGEISVDDKLTEQTCDDDARSKADAARSKRLDALAASKEAEAGAAWAKLKPGAESCAKLTDSAMRADCAAKVEAFVKVAASASVMLTAGDEVVATSCGQRTRAFAAESRGVTVAEVAEARTLAAALRAAPASTASVSTVSAASASSSSLIDTGLPGLGDEVIQLPGGTFFDGVANERSGPQ